MIAKLIEYCARNKLLVGFGLILATAGSYYALTNIRLDAIPDLSDPQVIVFTEWMGRSPDLVEDQITYPIVSSLLAAPHVEAVRGYSMFGMSFIYVIFKEGTNVYWARSRVLEYMSSIRNRLPQGVNPILGPDATSIGWVFQYALVDKTGQHDLSELRTFQDFTLRYALASVPGVAEVAAAGGYQKQYQVEVDPAKLHAYGLSIGEVSRAIRASNNEVGGRVIEMTQREYFVRGRGYVQDLAALQKVSLGADRNGVPILLGNIAKISYGPEIRRGFAEFDGIGEAVGGTVLMRYGENALEVIKRVKQKIKELEPSFPKGVELKIVYDRSGLIERAIETLKGTLIEEGIVVSLIIIIFLLHLRSSLVAIIVLPIGVAMAFIPMHALGITSNIMSLGGIAIAIGAMVDATIVLVENAHKRLEKAPSGANRNRVIIDAAREVGPPIFFSLLIITVAFLPIFALTGQAGRLFKPLAYTKTFSMFFAAILSVTLAPALMTIFIRGRIFNEKNHPVSRFLIGLYKPFVYVALRNPKTTVSIGLAAIISAVPMVAKIGSEFMPALNEGDILYMPTTFPNISIEAAKQYVQYQDRIIKQFPEVINVLGKAGRFETPTDPAPLSMVETVVQLKPREQWRKIPEKRWYSSWVPDFLKSPFRWIWPEERTITWQELTREMDQALKMPGWTNAWTMPIKTRVDMLTTGIRTVIGVKIFGNDLKEIEKIGLQLERALSPIRSTRSAYYERTTGGYYVDITPDRDAIARYGLTIRDVEDVIEAAVGGMPIEVTIEGRNRFTINVRYPRDLRQSVDRLKEVLVPIRVGLGTPSSDGMGAMSSFSSKRPLLLASAERMSDVVSDVPLFASAEMPSGSISPGMSSRKMSGKEGSNADVGGAMSARGGAHVPLGQIADIRIVTGPPMIRDEAGMLVGYVYVDMDQGQRDIGGYVKEAKAKVAKEVKLPPGYYLKWTGQYELMEQMNRRMRVVVPVTLALVILLLYLNFRNFTETLIVLASVPFALVGSLWLMYFLGYNFSTATWVGIIALVGLATETGIVMIVYLDAAYMRRKKAGKIRDLNDIIWAHMEGTVMRVRPKLMTVSTMMIGLVPLLWAQGSGADVMKRIAAPMVGGLATSAFLTLEIIPVVYTYWRLYQIKREKRKYGYVTTTTGTRAI